LARGLVVPSCAAADKYWRETGASVSVKAQARRRKSLSSGGISGLARLEGPPTFLTDCESKPLARSALLYLHGRASLPARTRLRKEGCPHRRRARHNHK